MISSCANSNAVARYAHAQFNVSPLKVGPALNITEIVAVYSMPNKNALQPFTYHYDASCLEKLPCLPLTLV